MLESQQSQYKYPSTCRQNVWIYLSILQLFKRCWFFVWNSSSNVEHFRVWSKIQSVGLKNAKSASPIFLCLSLLRHKMSVTAHKNITFLIHYFSQWYRYQNTRNLSPLFRNYKNKQWHSSCKFYHCGNESQTTQQTTLLHCCSDDKQRCSRQVVVKTFQIKWQSNSI